MSNGNAPDATTKPIMAKDATLRDIFAGQALITYTKIGVNTLDAAVACYAYADAMIAQRQKENWKNEKGEFFHFGFDFDLGDFLTI